MKTYKLFANRPIAMRERAWVGRNGATRPCLVIINKTGKEISPQEPIFVKIGVLDKGRHHYIFLNPAEFVGSAEPLGLFFNGSYGYEVVSGEEIYARNSVGGPGNSESKYGLYRVGAVLEESTYKGRQGSTYYKLTLDGWVCLGQDAPIEEDEIQEI